MITTTRSATDRTPAECWRTASSLVLHKLLGELSYEGVLSPVAGATPESWAVDLPSDVRYRFLARRGAFESWVVRAGSAVREAGGVPVEAWDPRVFVLDARGTLEVSGLRLAEVLAELIATITNEATRLAAAPTVAQLSSLGYDRADGHLTGHQRLVLNKGRVGFAETDRAKYAPEAGQPLRVRWMAAHRTLASFRGVSGLSEQGLLRAELGERTTTDFQVSLSAVGDPAEYVWLPVHPWQRDEIVGTLYAEELADGRIVDLGDSPDRYVPHQTVRTLANLDHPRRMDVKTALSVRNTSVYRGLGSAATHSGPAVTEWLMSIALTDTLLTHTHRLEMLGEVASVWVRHPVFADLAEVPYRFRETLGVLWRESIVTRLAPDERAWSFAALPYRDPTGASVVSELMRASGLAPLAWMRLLLDATLVPLLHWLVRYGVAFIPHGQNLILIVDGRGRPLRVALKDFAQGGVDLLDEGRPEHALLPGHAEEQLLRWPAHLLSQSLFSALFNGELRFLAETLLEDSEVARGDFWEVVREVVHGYRADHPESTRAFDAYRMFDERVERGCRNREHLSGTRFDKVVRRDEYAWRRGTVANPLFGADPGGAW